MFGDARLPGRFWSKVAVDASGCWIWTASKQRRGYGQFQARSYKSVRAHKYAYEVLVGPVGVGLELDHLCRERSCVNPGHLEPVTHAENVRRGMSGAYLAARVQCPKGHPYDDANTRRADGRRSCRTCERERVAAARRARVQSGFCADCPRPADSGSRCELHAQRHRERGR